MTRTKRSKWHYLVPRRERDIVRALLPLLDGVRQALDFECGCSPLAPYLLAAGIAVIGIDRDIDIIDELREFFPQGYWVLGPSAEFHLTGDFQPDLLIWMGIDASPPGPFWRLVQKAGPRVVLLEFAEAFAPARRTATFLAQALQNEYELKAEGFTEHGEGQYLERTFWIYEKRLANGTA